MLTNRVFFETEGGGDGAPAGGGAEAPAAPSEAPTTAPVVVDAPAAESAPEAPSAPAPKEDVSAKRFAALSHKEREIRQRQEEFKRKEADLQRKVAEVEARNNAPKPKTAMEALKAAGYSYQEATAEMLGLKVEEPKDPNELRFQEVDQKLSAIEELKAEVKRLQDERVAERDANIRSQINNAISTTIKQNPDKYEFLEQHGDHGVETVFSVIQQHYDQTGGETLSWEAACDKVENYYEGYAKKLATAKKLQAKATPPSAPAPKASPKSTGTLTNADSSTTSKQMTDTEFNKLPKDEQFALLAKQIKFLEG